MGFAIGGRVCLQTKGLHPSLLTSLLEWREALNCMSDETCALDRHWQLLSPASSIPHNSSGLCSQMCTMSNEHEAGSQTFIHKGQRKHSSLTILASIVVSLADVTVCQMCPSSYNLKGQVSVIRRLHHHLFNTSSTSAAVLGWLAMERL